MQANGSLDLSRLVQQKGYPGVLELDLQAFWDSWNSPPSAGNIRLQERSPLQLGPEFNIEDLQLKAKLSDNSLQLLELKTNQPAQLDCTGEVKLNWSNLMQSAYQVQGSLNLGTSRNEFQNQGRLADLGKLR
ncbi:MAG: hypothetical protein ACOCP7_02650 [Desulfohalobiaceae bacterium]